LKKIWGNSLQDKSEVGRVFVKFLTGKIKKLPWIGTPVSLETGPILDTLIDINTKGCWTINSQPNVNGVSSENPNFGWGPSGGYVYQKAYIEFFASPEDLDRIETILSNYESPHRYNYQAMNRAGESRSNIQRAVAVTWGIFPGQQIAQPTVVDPASFKVWSEEAFSLWQTWQVIYDEEDTSRHIIDEIINTYFLVTLVDNEFVSSDFFTPIFSSLGV